MKERDREDDTYVLWDDDECDPLALLMVDRKTEIHEDHLRSSDSINCFICI